MGKVKAGYIKEYTNPPKSDPKNAEFIVYFRETRAYNGGFGMDYMSGEPDKFKGSSEIKYSKEIKSNNWADFEKLYNPTKIYNQPYYTTWISMYKNNFAVTGEEVVLTLYVEKQSGNWDNNGITDEIVFAPKEGLRFVPDRLPAKTANRKEITVYCDTELVSDFLYEIKDQNNNIIGVLNFYNNAIRQQRKIDIRLVNVKLFGNESFNTSINDMKNWLAKEGFNQAMISANFDTTIEQLDLSLPQYVPNINMARTANGRIQNYTTDYPLLDKIIEKNDSKNKSNALTYYFINKDAVDKDKGYDPQTGDPIGWLNGLRTDSVNKSVIIFNKANSKGYKKGTVVHEGLHALGLSHFFSNGPDKKNGKFFFTQYETDNIMDYYKDGTTDKRKRLIKWQWDEIRKDKSLL